MMFIFSKIKNYAIGFISFSIAYTVKLISRLLNSLNSKKPSVEKIEKEKNLVQDKSITPAEKNVEENKENKKKEESKFMSKFQKKPKPEKKDLSAQKPTQKKPTNPKKRQNASSEGFVKKMEKNPNLVYLIRGKDNGKPAWHYVLIDKSKLQLFLKEQRGGTIDVSQYGKILYSGWGVDPDPETVKKIADEFGS